MELASRKLLVGMTAGLLLLTACGGSSDDGAGQLSEFQVQPSAGITLTSGTAACPGSGGTPAKVGEFLVVGGTAPYTAYSAFPDILTFGPHLATTPTHMGTFVISDRNSQFSVFSTGCFSGDGSITVMDSLKRVVNVSATSASGSGT
jgi:hypothetical protein